MGRGAGDDFETAGILQFAKCPNDIALQRFDEKFARLGEELRVKARQLGELRIVLVALDFLRGEIDQALEVAEIALLQQLVAQHRAEGRGERQREPEVDAFVDQPPHHAQEREISFGDGLEEPVFLEEILVFRVPNERQMRVEDERERPGHGQTRPGPRFAERRLYSVRQKSWNRSSPFLITSMLVA